MNEYESKGREQIRCQRKIVKKGKRKQEKKLREGSTLSLCLKGRVGFKRMGRKGTVSETVMGGMGCAWGPSGNLVSLKHRGREGHHGIKTAREVYPVPPPRMG